ncbi:FkbM family methyltransferase [Natrinema salsiterrestre]|uniref:FkbM family methyltransferase n=1 Tax=Natrinema salsiterrestre TaxID=2950540 RepID=A0A9Q4L339_9EURY|nr:FkbM family methyltransferase [Natrinema salsiterrestre]MDF9745978.1 FkbM family methyltransferase [Natrinema salsiterrestre]
MEVLRKFRAFVSDPKGKVWWAKHSVGEILLLIRQRRLGALISYFIAAVTGWRVYDYYIDWIGKRNGMTIRREIRGNPMVLNLEDEGLSRDLFLYGVREQRGIQIFEQELKQIRDEVDNGLVLEIGANIGYFALMELEVLRDSAEVIAFEPDERNTKLLEQNLELNGYRNRTTIERVAIGPECGKAELELSTHSNLNKIRAPSTSSWRYDTGESITVDMWSVDEYLTKQNHSPESVIAVRMDIEGLEVEVLQSLKPVLEADGPLVLSLEVHANLLDLEKTQHLLDILDHHGFIVAGALTETITIEPFVSPKDVDDIQDLSDCEMAYNLIVTKKSSTEKKPAEPLKASSSD